MSLTVDSGITNHAPTLDAQPQMDVVSAANAALDQAGVPTPDAAAQAAAGAGNQTASELNDISQQMKDFVTAHAREMDCRKHNGEITMHELRQWAEKNEDAMPGDLRAAVLEGGKGLGWQAIAKSTGSALHTSKDGNHHYYTFKYDTAASNDSSAPEDKGATDNSGTSKDSNQSSQHQNHAPVLDGSSNTAAAAPTTPSDASKPVKENHAPVLV